MSSGTRDQGAWARRLASAQVEAEDNGRGERWGDLLELRAVLETDTDQWAHVWAPLLAVASRRLRQGDGLQLLADAVAKGFRQPETFGDHLPETFGSGPSDHCLIAATTGRIDVPSRVSW